MDKKEKSKFFVISKEIYLALHPMDQIIAQALQKYELAKILYDDPKFKDLLKKK